MIPSTWRVAEKNDSSEDTARNWNFRAEEIGREAVVVESLPKCLFSFERLLRVLAIRDEIDDECLRCCCTLIEGYNVAQCALEGTSRALRTRHSVSTAATLSVKRLGGEDIRRG